MNGYKKVLVLSAAVIIGLAVAGFGPTVQECFLTCTSDNMDCRTKCRSQNAGKDCYEECEKQLKECNDLCLAKYRE